MIRPTAELRRFELREARERAVSHARALEIFAALWSEACLLDPAFPGRWQEDLAPDLAVARAVDGLAPAA
jgi:hypothetical protein